MPLLNSVVWREDVSGSPVSFYVVNGMVELADPDGREQQAPTTTFAVCLAAHPPSTAVTLHGGIAPALFAILTLRLSTASLGSGRSLDRVWKNEREPQTPHGTPPNTHAHQRSDRYAGPHEPSLSPELDVVVRREDELKSRVVIQRA